jgi:shikimate kinase
LGGGAFVEPPNRELLEEHGVTVWLDCPFEVVTRRVAGASNRPLARDPETFAELFHFRRDIYALAAVCIPIESDNPEIAVEAIVRHPKLQ